MMSAEEARRKIVRINQELEEIAMVTASAFVEDNVRPVVEKTVDRGEYFCDVPTTGLSLQELLMVKQLLVSKGYTVVIPERDGIYYMTKEKPQGNLMIVSWFPKEGALVDISVLDKIRSKLKRGN